MDRPAVKRAVIFDMDGVLIDSFDAHFESWVMLAHEIGGSYPREAFDTDFGRTSREIIAHRWGDLGEPLTDARIAEMDDRKEALFRDIIAAKLPVMPGAPELIASLVDAGFSLAVGSSGPPENVHLTVDGLGASQFGAVVTGMDVSRGKPDPEVFLSAAAKLGVPPAQCAVVEDAAPGVAAANAAGMVSIGLVSTGRKREQLNEADWTVDRLDELSPDAIARRIEKNCS